MALRRVGSYRPSSRQIGYAAAAAGALAPYVYRDAVQAPAYLYNAGKRFVSSYMSRPSKPIRLVPVKGTYSRYSKPYVKRKTKKLATRVKAVEQKLRDETSLVIYKFDDKDTLKPAASTAAYGFKSAVSTATLELALAQARFFDPANPGTLITASLASPTFTQRCLVSVYSKILLTNNYQVPCVISYGVAYPKADTNISPNTAFTQGLADCGNPDATSIMLSWKDSQEFNKLWRVKVATKLLKPGGSVSLTHKQSPFTFDPSFFDSHALTYTKDNKSCVFIYRIQGVLGHDTTVTTEQGFLPAGIDVNVKNIYRVHYNSGGASVKTIVLNETSSQSFTNAGVVSEQPVADNISYSLN